MAVGFGLLIELWPGWRGIQFCPKPYRVILVNPGDKMADFRIKAGFFHNVKTRRLQKRLGCDGIVALLRLWDYCTINKTDGCLGAIDKSEIDLICEWGGQENELFDTLIELGFLDENDGEISLHDWLEHNPWVAESHSRKERARKGGRASGKSRRNSPDKTGTSNLNEEVVRTKTESSSNTLPYLTLPSPSLPIPSSPNLTLPELETVRGKFSENPFGEITFSECVVLGCNEYGWNPPTQRDMKRFHEAHPMTYAEFLSAADDANKKANRPGFGYAFSTVKGTRDGAGNKVNKGLLKLIEEG